MKSIIVFGVVLVFGTFAFAKKDEKQTLIDSMVKNCKAELASEPALTDTNDGDAVWKNLEDKEKTLKLSKKCDAAHEKFERKYHKEDKENDEEKVGEKKGAEPDRD